MAPAQFQSGTAPASSGSGTSSGSTNQPTPVTPAQSSSGSTTAAQPATVTAQTDATQARFNRPLGVAVDTNGTLYVADSYNFTIRKITRSGVVTTLAGSPGMAGSADGVGAAARFTFPQGVAVDTAGNVYVVDANAIRKVSASGAVTTLAGTTSVKGNADGSGANAQFNQPWGIAVDKDGNLYVADTENYLIRKITQAGLVTTLAGTRGMRGSADGTGVAATFIGPRGIAIDAAGNLYVSDWFGPPAPMIPEGSTFIRKIAANGAVSTMAGSYGSSSAPAVFRDISAIAADAAGNVYAADYQSIRKISPTGAVSTFVSSSTQFDALQGIAMDGAGTLFVTDTYTINKVTADGTINVVAGKFGEMGSADTQ
jgi:sugar lactone lactonase YvrE